MSDTATPEAIRLRFEEDIAVVVFDEPDSKVNTLNSRLSSQFEAAFSQISSRGGVRAIVLISAKPDCFIAGADIKELAACSTAEEAEGLSRGGQQLLDRLAGSNIPVLAAIHGSCLGGGLEVALACHYRLATDHAKTNLALPEVMLGLLPGAGGTQRLPRLVGIRAALDMMLTGRNIQAKRARKMGLVDALTDPYDLEATAIKAARQLADGKLAHKPRKQGLVDVLLEGTAPGRNFLFKKARETVAKQTGGHYPAAPAILDAVEVGMNAGMVEGLSAESRRFGQLAMTGASGSLTSLFFGQTSLKKNRYGTPERTVDTLGILGAGLMGAGIGLVSVRKDMRVLLKDISAEGVARGRKAIYAPLNKRVKRKAMTSFERDRLMANVIGLTDYTGFAQADMVIEAVFEDLGLKQRIIRELEEHIPDHCVIASNTSALPIHAIAEASKTPERVVGMHYFSPVPKMPLLEVVVHDKTSDEVAAQAVQVGLRQGKTVIVVKDGPGFYTTRILAPFMDEAALLLQEGIGFHELDRIMKAWGYPVGPVTLLDEVGLDVGAHVGRDLGKALGPRVTSSDPAALEAIVQKGILGRKSGKGFYLYPEKKKKGPLDGLMAMIKPRKGGKPINPEVVKALAPFQANQPRRTFDPIEVQHRMALRMVNEAVLCLQEGILATPVDGDIGAVFGLGFPPFRGGPFRWVDTTGAERVVALLEDLRARFGDRYAPAQLLQDHARNGTRFHAE